MTEPLTKAAEKIMIERFNLLAQEQRREIGRLISDDPAAAFWWLRSNGFKYNHALDFDEAARFIAFVKELENHEN